MIAVVTIPMIGSARSDLNSLVLNLLKGNSTKVFTCKEPAMLAAALLLNRPV
jgi:hypothetical protein